LTSPLGSSEAKSELEGETVGRRGNGTNPSKYLGRGGSATIQVRVSLATYRGGTGARQRKTENVIKGLKGCNKKMTSGKKKSIRSEWTASNYLERKGSGRVIRKVKAIGLFLTWNPLRGSTQRGGRPSMAHYIRREGGSGLTRLELGGSGNRGPLFWDRYVWQKGKEGTRLKDQEITGGLIPNGERGELVGFLKIVGETVFGTVPKSKRFWCTNADQITCRKS